jgi:N-acetylglutamate synthase-like GNAT family acetyltransferase
MIRKANEKDIHDIEDILHDAVEWMNANNISNLWNENNICWSSLSQKYNINDFYIAYVGSKPVGCMAITNVDKTYWPSNESGTSLYIHKLAVKQDARGIGISKELIDYVKEKACKDKIKAIRLDCNANRKKLRNIYENYGFRYVETVSTEKGYQLALYVCDID